MAPVFNAPPQALTFVQSTGQRGLETRPIGLRTGGHSGYAAINLAYLLGARVIILLGYDMQPSVDGRHHAAGIDRPRHPRYLQWLPLYAELRWQLAMHGVHLLNASRATAIPTEDVPRVALDLALHHYA